MRRKCFEESFFFPLQSILTITHISSGSCIHYYTYPKLPTAKKVSAFVSFRPLSKPRREERGEKNVYLLMGREKSAYLGIGNFNERFLSCLARCHCIPYSTVHEGMTMYESSFPLPLSPSISFARLERKIFFPATLPIPAKGKEKIPAPSVFIFRRNFVLCREKLSFPEGGDSFIGNLHALIPSSSSSSSSSRH